MKIKLDMAGARPTHPDFALLRAGLAAVQAATPTALASQGPRAPIDPKDALYAIFAEGDSRDAAAAMQGSFNSSAAAQLDRQER